MSHHGVSPAAENTGSLRNRTRRSSARRRITLALIAATAWLGFASTVEAQLRVATYNVAGLNGRQSSLRSAIESLADDFAPDSGTIRAVDILILQEIDNNTSNTILGWMNADAPPGAHYTRATFTSDSNGTFENALIYNDNTIVEDVAGHKDISNHTGPRATDRWKLSVVGQFGGLLYVYGSHFKADTGSSNESKRESQANAIRNDADALGDGINIIYAGDFNLYSSGEPAYQRFFDPGPGRAVDPKFRNDFNSPIVHSQSPSDGTGGLVTGGMDDRFDFLLCTEELIDGSGIDYDSQTYRSFGNDGQHFNKAINDGFNSYFLANEQALKADDLAKGSDHLPVVVDLLLNGDFFTQTVTTLKVGNIGLWSVAGAQPNKTVYFVYSLKGLGVFNVSSLNATLRLSSPKLAASRKAKPNGTASLQVSPPSNLRGSPIWFQGLERGETTDVVLRIVQ